MSRADGAFHTTGEIEANQIQGAKAYADAHKTTAGRVAMGAISAFTPTSYSEETGMARDVYTDKQKKELLKNKEKTSYKVGEFAGNALAFALPGVAGAKKADAVLKGTKTIGGRALNLAKRTGIETAYNTPMNAYQALKGARDENGNLSLENYGKTLVENTAFDYGMGAGFNLVGAGANILLGKRYIDLLAKAESGKATPKELEQIQKLKESFNAKSEIASHYANSDKMQTAINKTDDVVAHAKSDAPLSKSESDELINLKAKEKTGNATVGDKVRIADLENKAETVIKERNIKRTQTRVEALDKLSGDTGIKYKMVSNEEMHAKAKELDKEYDPSNDYNGVKFNDENGKPTVYINKDSEKSFYVTVGHETLHAIKGADVKEYNNLAKLISDYAKANDSEGYEQLASAMKRDYSAGEFDEEMTAELVGKYLFGDDGEKFIQNIATKEPNIFKKLYDYVMRAFGKEDPELAKVRDSFEKIYRQTEGNIKSDGKADFSASKKNEGYHAGDLGKSESLFQQSGGRGTGHYGTGTYFVGDKARIEGYNAREGKPAPVETVDFTDYNLYKPKDYEQGHSLHEFLKGVNEYYDTPDNLKTKEGVRSVAEQAEEIDTRLYEASGEYEEMYWDDDLEDWMWVPAPRNEMAIRQAKSDLFDLAEKNLGKSRTEDIAKVDPDADADSFLRENGWVTSPDKMSDETVRKLLKELTDDRWHSWQDMANDRAEFFENMGTMIRDSGFEGREKEISDALSKIRDELQNVRYPESTTHDSASTLLMKRLGYEGIDVRGIDQLDNTKYGSVIYDLKGDALKRKQEIGTAKFSKIISPKSLSKQEYKALTDDAFNNWAIEKRLDKTGVVEAHSANHSAVCKVNEGKVEILSVSEAIGRERSKANESVGRLYKKPDGFNYDIEGIKNSRKNNSNDSGDVGIRQSGRGTDGLGSGRLQERNKRADSPEGRGFNGGGKEYYDLNKEQSRPIAKTQHLLDKAMEMYEDGAPADYITETTGLFRDSEGKWREAKNGNVNFSKSKKKKEQKPTEEVGSFNSAKETSNDGVAVKNDRVKKDEVPYRLTADEETYKNANVSTKSLTNMTNEQLEKELSSLEYVKKNKGKTPEHQRLRDERMKAIRGELLARKKADMKKPTREMIASADDLENSANGEFRDDISRLGKETKKATQSFYRLFVDTFSGFEKYASTLPKEMRTEVQSAVNSLRNARNKAGGWVTEGRVLDGKVVGKPLKDIMGDLLKKGNSEKYLAFQDYAFNLHNIDRANSGKEVFGGVSAEESKAIVDELARKYPEFENIQKEINDYFKDLQQYRVETGLASKDTVDYLDALYPNYVPTYRLREPAPANDFAKGSASVDQIYKVAKGGDQKVIPLHEQITNQTEYTLKMGEQNRLFSTIAKMQGFEAKDIDPNVTINDAVQASLIPVRTTDGATYKHKVTFFDNGEPKTVEINQQMYDGILEWRKDKATLVDMFNWKSKPLRGMQRANSLFKNLITGWNPLFGITNIVKDTGEALLYTKNVFGFIKSYPKAVSQILRKGEYFKLYEANGGKYAHLRDVLTTFDTSKFKKWSNPIQWCQSFNDTLEAIPRMAEFISTVDKRTNGDLSNIDSKIANEALMNANEVTLNFGRKGIYGHAMNSTAFPYLNPAIQGVDKLIRVFREAGADGVKGIASLSAKIAAFAVAPALANEIFMEHFGGQAYQDLNSRDKDNFLFIPMGDGKFIKIPKSRVGSALASPAMHFFRYAQYGDDMEWKQMFETAWDNVGVSNPLESSLFSPLALAYMNKTWYGGSIESMSDADLRAVGEAGKIYDSTTSAIAIWIGGKTNISPKKIDYIIDAYTGVIGDIALPYTAEASQGNPLAKKFIMDSVFSNDLSTSFWDKNANMESMSKVKGGKNTDKYNDWKSTYMYDALTLNDAVKAIDADKNLTKAEKAKLKRGIKIQLNNVYRSAVNGEPCDVEPISVISDAIGADKALSMYLPTKKEKSGTDTWGDYYKAYKKSTDYKNLTPKQREANAKKFLNVYSKGVEVQKAIDATDYHDRPDWGTTGVVIAELQKQGKLSKKQANTISESCGVWESSMKAYGKYMKFDGNTKRYVVTQKRLNKMYESMEIDTGTGIWKGSFGKGGVKGGAIAMQLSTSKVEFADRAYYISNYSDENMMLKMNASRGFAKKYGHTTEEIIKMANKADKKGDNNTYLSQGEVRDYCDNMKGNSEEKAMAFILLGGNPNKNPYGPIGDYSSKRDTGITADAKESSGGRGRRRGGYGHHRGGGGGGKGSDDWMAWLEEQGIIGGTSATGGTSVKVKDNTSESALNDAYRKRVRKLMTNK